MKTRIAGDLGAARRAKRPNPAAGTAGWENAAADRARIRTVLRAPPDWRAPATTSLPASTTQRGDAGAPIAAPAADQAMPAPEVAATSALPQISRKAAGASLVLQRKCACGAGASGLTGECEECSKKKTLALQTKLRVHEPGDVYEQEADRVAEQVLAKSAHLDVSGAPPRIQRFSGQSSGQVGTVPASVEHVLAGPGRPLEPALRQDMEQRFGHDFSRVRVHSDAAAETSARHVNAHAYTAGYDIVFGTGQFAPETINGRRLLAHELTHVVQQSDAGRSGCAPLAVQREKSDKQVKTKTADDFTVELDHGRRGRYLIHFARPRALDDVLRILFVDATLPQGTKLEDQGIDMLGWTWKFTTAAGVIEPGTFQKLTPAFQKHFSPDRLRLTDEESASIHARSEAFMESRPVYLGGQSVREAFKDCRDNKVGEGVWSGCWGRRAGYFYYVGWQAGYTERVLEVRSSPVSQQIIKDWEWWLNQGYTLHDAAREEEELQLEILKQMIFAYASALSAAPGAVRRPTVPPSPVRQVGQIAVKGVQTYEAWKTALGKGTTELDMWLTGLAGILGAGTELLPANKQPPSVKTKRLPSTDPTHVPPPALPVLGSKGQTPFSSTYTPRGEEAVGAGPSRRISPVDRGRGARPFYAKDPMAPPRTPREKGAFKEEGEEGAFKGDPRGKGKTSGGAGKGDPGSKRTPTIEEQQSARGRVLTAGGGSGEYRPLSKNPDIGVLEVRDDGSVSIVSASRQDDLEPGVKVATHINLANHRNGLGPITPGAARYRFYMQNGKVIHVEPLGRASQTPERVDEIERALQRNRLVSDRGTFINLAPAGQDDTLKKTVLPR